MTEPPALQVGDMVREKQGTAEGRIASFEDGKVFRTANIFTHEGAWIPMQFAIIRVGIVQGARLDKSYTIRVAVNRLVKLDA